MATLEEVASHRDQLKTENDRLNPENDSLKLDKSTLTESLRLASESIADLRSQLAAKVAQNDELKVLAQGLAKGAADANKAANAEKSEAEETISQLTDTLVKTTAALNDHRDRNAAALKLLLEQKLDTL